MTTPDTANMKINLRNAKKSFELNNKGQDSSSFADSDSGSDGSDDD
eukprot:CAMPEP_0170454612 /NCGR_PEP_ID=MMETSP0123-20130129/2804_1 /TAXON_ID=182087 /ORGANISM="Favella ehrenbergii, Strain Fehren 1" /LENGTH=45 /DNA_ID= /DNA_START= /DNA_END= /DNA_ORIENTATION=